MQTLSRFTLLVAAGLLAAGSVMAAPAGKATVQPRSLMTAEEIANYRRSMQAAPNEQARAAIKAAKYTQLRQRANERGVMLAEPAPKSPGMRPAEAKGKAPAKEAAPKAPPRAP